jgi:hypothetical protein
LPRRCAQPRTNSLGVPTLIVGPGPNNGIYSFAAAGVTYNSIESRSRGGAANVVLDMQLAGFRGGGDSDEIFVRLDGPGTNLLIDVDGVPVFGAPLPVSTRLP